MAVTAGKWEGEITVPSGGWTIHCTDDGGGPTAVVITAGTYYLSSAGSIARDFIAELAFQMNAAMAETWTVSIGAGEGGTGKVTISCTGPTCTVTFTETKVRDILGWTGNLAGSTSYTSPNQAEGLWLPDGPPMLTPRLQDPRDRTDQTQTVTTAGHVNTIVYQRLTEHTGVTWQGISRAKARIAGESTTGESLQQFQRDVLWQDLSYFTIGHARIYPDANIDTTYKDWRIVGDIGYRPMVEGWDEQWYIDVPRLIEEP
jgi:hypothetical protein